MASSYTNVGWAPGTATLSYPGYAAFRFDPLRDNSRIINGNSSLIGFVRMACHEGAVAEDRMVFVASIITN
jgi:hypothetical protein